MNHVLESLSKLTEGKIAYYYITGIKNNKEKYINKDGKWDGNIDRIKKFKNLQSAKTYIKEKYLNTSGFDEVKVKSGGSIITTVKGNI